MRYTNPNQIRLKQCQRHAALLSSGIQLNLLFIFRAIVRSRILKTEINRTSLIWKFHKMGPTSALFAKPWLVTAAPRKVGAVLSAWNRRRGTSPPKASGKLGGLLHLNTVLTWNRAQRKSNCLSKGNPSSLTLFCFILERQVISPAAKDIRQGKVQFL